LRESVQALLNDDKTLQQGIAERHSLKERAQFLMRVAEDPNFHLAEKDNIKNQLKTLLHEDKPKIDVEKQEQAKPEITTPVPSPQGFGLT
jgi:hypothetical protein